MIYRKFKDSLLNEILGNRIAIAVSGGSDSMALLFLMHRFIQTNKKIELFCFSVDHNLRHDSKIENQHITKICNELNIQHFQLFWQHENHFSNLQSRARKARYDMMSNLCHKLDILTIMTAHHCDDYIENFCMREKRKSSAFGLSSTNVTFYNNIRILRPLYYIYKSELIDYLEQNNIEWFEDESNHSNKYTRNIVRKELLHDEIKKENKLIKHNLANEQFENELRPLFIEALCASVNIHDEGFSIINLNDLRNFPIEIKSQLIAHVLIITSGNYKNIRYDSLKLICNLLDKSENFIKTLHDSIIQKQNNNIIIYRELTKIEKLLILQNNIIWDNRFKVTIENNIEINNYYISNLTIDDYVKIKNKLNLEDLKNISFNNHKKILFTLPVIYYNNYIISIPHINYYNIKDESEKELIPNIKINFFQQFTSRFTHFK